MIMLKAPDMEDQSAFYAQTAGALSELQSSLALSAIIRTVGRGGGA